MKVLAIREPTPPKQCNLSGNVSVTMKLLSNHLQPSRNYWHSVIKLTNTNYMVSVGKDKNLQFPFKVMLSRVAKPCSVQLNPSYFAKIKLPSSRIQAGHEEESVSSTRCKTLSQVTCIHHLQNISVDGLTGADIVITRRILEVLRELQSHNTVYSIIDPRLLADLPSKCLSPAQTTKPPLPQS